MKKLYTLVIILFSFTLPQIPASGNVLLLNVAHAIFTPAVYRPSNVTHLLNGKPLLRFNNNLQTSYIDLSTTSKMI